MDSKDFRKKRDSINSRLSNTISELDKGYKDAVRVTNIIENTKYILNDLDKQFEQNTGLTKTDFALLLLASGLQVIRQYFLRNNQFRFDSDKDADKFIEKGLSVCPRNWQDVLTESGS